MASALSLSTEVRCTGPSSPGRLHTSPAGSKPCWQLRQVCRICSSAMPRSWRGQELPRAGGRGQGFAWLGGEATAGEKVWLGHTPGPAPGRARDAYAGKSLAYCHPSWSVPPGTLKSTDQSETCGRGGSVGQNPSSAPAQPRAGSSPRSTAEMGALCRPWCTPAALWRHSTCTGQWVDPCGRTRWGGGGE